MGDAWFRVSPLSLFHLEFWSADCRLPSFLSAPLSRNLSFISFFSSDRIRLFFCFLFCFVFFCFLFFCFLFFFYREGHGLAEKLLLIIIFFFSFEKFHQHFAMR